MAKSKRYHGVYVVQGKHKTSYGIDYIHHGTGERVKKILKNAKSETEAFELRSIEIADAKRGAIDKSYELKKKLSVVSFEKSVDEYLKWSKENKKSWRTDEYNAKPLRKIFNGKLMNEINPFLVEKYKMLRKKEVAPRTINNEIALASQVFECAVNWNKWEGSNPFRKARFKVKKGKKPGSLSPDQVVAIMEEINHLVKRDMVEFAFNTGWRISEIRGLKWEDVDLEAGRAWIVDPKNSNTVEIDLNDEALQIITRQKKNGEYVFSHLNGNPYKTNLHTVIKNAAGRAGVNLPPRKAWHIFRRTWASMFLQAGGDVETLRVLGNWKDYSMPLWYADAGNSEYKRTVLNRLPKLSNGRNTEDFSKVAELTA